MNNNIKNNTLTTVQNRMIKFTLAIQNRYSALSKDENIKIEEIDENLLKSPEVRGKLGKNCKLKSDTKFLMEKRINMKIHNHKQKRSSEHYKTIDTKCRRA